MIFTILSTMMILGPSCLWIAKMWMSLKVKTMKSKARTVRPASYVLEAILKTKRIQIKHNATLNAAHKTTLFDQNTCMTIPPRRDRWPPCHICSSYPPHIASSSSEYSCPHPWRNSVHQRVSNIIQWIAALHNTTVLCCTQNRKKKRLWTSGGPSTP